MEQSLSKNPVMPEFLSGGGEMGQRIREFDWSKTPLGPVDQWPQSLRTCVRIMLTSRQPIWIGWGKELIKLYNDPYKEIVRGKHPWALGKPASVVWKEIWGPIEPMLKKVMEDDEGTYVESELLIMERNGYPEETYYTFSYTPVPGDSGGTAGMICANTDDTDRIISERQLKTLTTLGKNLTNCLSNEEIIEKTIRSLGENQYDFPYAIFYTIKGDKAIFAGSTELGKDLYRVPEEINLFENKALAEVLRQAVHSRDAQLLYNVHESLGNLPKGKWEISSDKAIVLPIVQAGPREPYGVLVIGFNPYRLPDEKYAGFFNLVADQVATSFADVHVLDEERKRSEALAEIDRAKTIFFSNISHEFRTPLTLMLSPVEEVLNDPQISSTNKMRMEVAYRNGLRMQKLVNTLLEFSRIEAGRVEGKFEKVDICSLTEGLASTFRSAIDKAGMTLEFRSSSIRSDVYVDTEMWERIILNLVSNAFKYSKRGSISIDVRQVDQEIQVSVADTGVGIPQDQLSKIFDRFHRVENTEGRSQEGTGIGLAMVKELVKLHSGTINVASVQGKGSIFTISIPAGKQHLPSEKIYDTSSPATGFKYSTAFVEEALKWLPEKKQGELDGQSANEAFDRQPGLNGNRFKVLLADDNADMRQYVQGLLSDRFNVITAGDGEEAWGKALAYKPDLLLSDIMMPRLDGYGLLKRMRSHPDTKNTPVIFLSARAGEEAKVEGLHAGADDYLIKPFSAKELIVRVSNHIRISEVRRETEKQFYQLFIQAPAIINVFKGPDFVFELFHPKNKEILGDVDYTGRALREVLPGLEGQGVIENLQEVYRSGKTIRQDEQHIRYSKGGVLHHRYFNSTYQPWYDLKGNIQGVINFAIDVTEAVEGKQKIVASEKQFKNVLVFSPTIFMMLKGPELNISFVNQPLLNSWGKSADIVGKNLLDVLPELKDQPFPKLLEHVYHTGQTHHGREEKAVVIKNGIPQEVYYDYVYQPIFEVNEIVSGVTVMATDITEQVMARKKIEESERKYRELSEELEGMVERRTSELKRSNEDLQQFAHVASHDLKEPVRKFRTFINRLKDEYGQQLPPQGRRYLDKMENASERMSSMIVGVLKYSGLNEAGQEIGKVDLNEIVKEIAEDLEVIIQQKDAVITKENLPTLEGASVLLYQLFYNLLNNSLKFCEQRPLINISSSIVNLHGHDFARILIADNGIGFDQAFADRIFEAFTRLNSKDKYEGTGLGLALCKKIVERHRGLISADGEENKGALFTVHLPLVQNEKKV
jgi:PAS domain S-box-containing protein